MIKREKWVDHNFNLGIAVSWAPNILTRVRDTEIRLVYHTQGLTEDQLSENVRGTWSIKEHIGHLIDLEALWIDRFGQFAALREELVAADMSNQKTKTANHNTTPLTEMMATFKSERNRVIQCFEKLPPNVMEHQAYHARLDVMMRPVDLLFFVAEHDDHHLTSIVEIKQKL